MQFGAFFLKEFALDTQHEFGIYEVNYTWSYKYIHRSRGVRHDFTALLVTWPGMYFEYKL